MAITAYLYNGKTQLATIVPKNGFVYRDEYNETRDSSTLVFRIKGRHADIEPFDFVIITGSVRGNPIAAKSFVVDSYNEEQVGFGDSEEYEITLNLFSQMKEMERVALPNLSITSLADGTSRFVIQYIRQYISEYAPKYKVQSQSPVGCVYANAWTISNEVAQRFASVRCPEFFWNKPTLAEVITDLMQVDDCIPVIKNNELGLIDLRRTYGEIDKTKIVGATRGMSSNDYNQNLVMNMQNAIGTNPTRIVEFASFRNESEGVLTTDNLQIVTQKPIYNIKRIAVAFRDKYYNDATRENEYRITMIDLTNHIKEKNEYDVLDPTAYGMEGDEYERIASTHQISNVYYKRGGNTIDGWSKTWNLILGERTTLYFMLDHLLQYQQGHHFDNHTIDDLDFRDLMFIVEYETIAEATLAIGRKLPLRNPHTASFDNQGSSYVDVDQQSIFEYAKANRLANKIISLNAVYHDDADVPELGQTYEGSIIFSREIQYFDDSIIFHAYATEHYVLLNYFVSIRAKRRSWAIASGNEALTRHENSKYYAEFSFGGKRDYFAPYEFNSFGKNIAKELLSPLYRFYNDETIKFAAFRSMDSNTEEQFPDVQNAVPYYVIECSSEAAGMSVSLTIQFADNYSAGLAMKKTGDTRANNLMPYANRYGEFTSYDAVYLSDYDPADGDFVWPVYYVGKNGNFNDSGFVPFDDQSVWDAMVLKGRQKPLSTNIETSGKQFGISRFTHKDNREIIALTTQFEFCADSDRIIINRRFIDTQKYAYANPVGFSGLPMLADSSFRAVSSLPAASAKYKTIGFIVASGGVRSYYLAAESNGAYSWAGTAISANTLFAVLEGYEQSASATNADLIGYGRKITVMRYENDLSLNALVDCEFIARAVACRVPIDDKTETIAAGNIIGTSPAITIGQTTPTYNRCYIELSQFFRELCEDSHAKSWAITDASNNVLLGVNIDENAGAEQFTLWLNVLKSRDDKIVESIANRQTLVGSIVD